MRTTQTFFTLAFLLFASIAEGQHAEKIVLNTDKQWYYPGEPLWFSLNVFNACKNTLSNLSKVAYVELIGSDSRPAHQMKVAIKDANGSGSFVITENIPTGNYTVVAYTNWMKNFGPSTFERRRIVVVNPSRPAPVQVLNNNTASTSGDDAIIKLEKKEYATRERVHVNISATAGSRVSAAVIKLDELQASILEPRDTQVVSSSADPCPQQFDRPLPFLPEERGHIVVARVIDKRTQKTASGIRGHLSDVNAPGDMFVATSDSAGMLRFEVGELSGRTELVLQTNSYPDSNYIIEMVSPYAAQRHDSPQAAAQNLFESQSAAINEGFVSAQVQQYFSSINSLVQDTLHNSDVPFYGKPDAFYLMSDYVQFSTVEEILREYVTTVGVQRRNGRLLPIVYDELADRKPFPEPPLVLVNGVPLFDVSQLMDMDSETFHSIAVVTKRYFFGRQEFYGIVDVRLSTPLKNFDGAATVIDYDGIIPARKFTAPSYNSDVEKNQRRPDFRRTLYWNPLSKASGNGECQFEFYTSDVNGKYAIVINAVSDKGAVQTWKTFIQVR